MMYDDCINAVDDGQIAMYTTWELSTHTLRTHFGEAERILLPSDLSALLTCAVRLQERIGSHQAIHHDNGFFI